MDGMEIQLYALVTAKLSARLGWNSYKVDGPLGFEYCI